MQAFRHINGRLYITKKAMVECGVSDSLIRNAKSQQYNTWKFIDTETEKSLIDYECLKDKYKILIQRKFGCPYEYIALEPIKQLIKRDIKALQFFENFTFDGIRRLPTHPINYVELYTRHAELFNMVSFVSDNKKVLKKDLCITMEVFWQTLVKIVQTGDFDKLPQTADNLRKRWQSYREDGYTSLISNKFNNQAAAKIKTEDHLHLLLKLIKAHHNLEDTIVALKYNEAVNELGWNFTISPQTVALYRKEYDLEVSSERKGKAQLMNRLRVAIQRSKPKMAGTLFEYDGWTVELLFQYKQNGQTKYNGRLELMAIYDPFNDYIVGYSIGSESVITIKEAIKDAVDNIYRLTGKYYLFNEFLTDNWGKGTLTPFYERVAMIHRYSKVGNAKDKSIEPFWNRLNNESFRTQPNTTGHNITSRKENQPNMDWLDKHKKMLPTIEQGYWQIKDLVEQHRTKREAEWLASFKTMEATGRLTEINRESYLLLFGKKAVETNKLTNVGIQKQIAGITYTFNSLDLAFRRMTHTNWSIVYDDKDLSNVMAINEDGSIRFMLEQPIRPAQALTDITPAQISYRNKVSASNKAMEKHITEFIANVDESTANMIAQTELKTMFIENGQQKTALQKAKNVIAIKENEEQNEEQSSYQAELEEDWWEDKDFIEKKLYNDLF